MMEEINSDNDHSKASGGKNWRSHDKDGCDAAPYILMSNKSIRRAQAAPKVEARSQQLEPPQAASRASSDMIEELQLIASGITAKTGETFFRELTSHLVRLLAVDYAFVGELHPETGHTIQTVAVCARGQMVENFTYQLAGSPCENVMGKVPCWYPGDVQQLIPHDALLAKMRIESYVGTPLFDAMDRALGLLVVMHSQPLHKPQKAAAMLQIFASRAAAELERQRTESVLRASEERYRTLVGNLPKSAVQLFDHDLRFTLCDGPELAAIGLHKESIEGKTIWEIYSPETCQQLEPFYRAILAGESTTVETTYAGRAYRVHGAPTKDAQGKIGGGLILALNITDQKRIKNALQESETRYRELFEYATDAIYEHDLAGNFTAFNRSAERLTGYSLEEILQMSVAHVVAPEDKLLAQAMTARRVVGDTVPPYELKLRTKDGREIMVEISARLISREGQPVGVQGIARDLTERKQAEADKQQLQQQLFQAEKLKAVGTLAGGVAHDFNNLLLVMMGNLELALDNLHNDTRTRRYVEETLKAGQRAAMLVRQLLTFSRPNDAAAHRPIRLHEVIMDTLQLLRLTLPTTIRVQCVFFPSATKCSLCVTEEGSATTLGCPWSATVDTVWGDAAQLQQILMNLCLNALHAMEGAVGVLEVRLERVDIGHDAEPDLSHLQVGPYVRISIHDTGCGMSLEVKKQIFEPFFTTKPVGKGTGLGLSVVYGIVHNHGGALTVESQPGAGTTISVYLPAFARKSA